MNRGSALVYVIFVIFSITAIALVGAKFATASNSQFDHTLKDAQFQAMADGAVAEAKSDAYKGNLSVGTRTTTYAGGSVTTTVANHPTIDRALVLTVTSTLGDRSFRVEKVIGNRAAPNPANYALWVATDYSDSLLATVINGSAYFEGNATLSGVWSVRDDFYTKGTSTLSLGTTVGGNYLTGVRDQTMVDFRKEDYTDYTSVGNTIGNVTFGPETAGRYDGLTKSTGNLTLSGGTITGRGTIFVDGSLNVNGNYNYADAASRVVFLVRGKVNFSALTTQVVGTFFSRDSISIPGVSLNVSRGNLCTKKDFNRLLAAVTVNQEIDLLKPLEATKHRIPGCYP